jgi:hypothetical protein
MLIFRSPPSEGQRFETRAIFATSGKNRFSVSFGYLDFVIEGEGQLQTHAYSLREIPMFKCVVASTALLALMGTAVAADLPHPQPVVSTAPIGKYPIGKSPVGKYPVGKTPVVTTKG